MKNKTHFKALNHLTDAKLELSLPHGGPHLFLRYCLEKSVPIHDYAIRELYQFLTDHKNEWEGLLNAKDNKD